MKQKLIIAIAFLLGLGVLPGYLIAKRIVSMRGKSEAAAKHTVTDNPQYNEQLKIWGAYWGPRSIVMLGDSHMYKCHWDELLSRDSIANQGIGSDITEGYLARIGYVFDVKPRICFIEGGGNDIEYKIAPAEIVANIQRIVDTLKPKGIICVLTTVPYELSTLAGAQQYNGAIDELNARVRMYAYKNGLDYIDLNGLTARDGALNPDEAQNDGAHLTAAAYVNWKLAMEKILKKYKL